MKKIRSLRMALVSFLLISGSIWTSDSSKVSTEDDRKSVSITIYNQGIGLVRETRSLSLGKGIQSLRFEGVPSQILPQTVRISGPSVERLQIYEQNYEYDLLSSDRLLEKYLGKEITLFHKNPTSGEETPYQARLISKNEGNVFQIGNQIVVDPSIGKFSVPEIPENLYAKPTLVWKLKSSFSETQDLEVSFQTQGMSWNADYILSLEKNEDKASLHSWVTINNQSGARYNNAVLQLIAGKVQFLEQPNPESYYRDRFKKKSMPLMSVQAPAPPTFEQENLSEYYLYTLDQSTDLGSNQTKQLRLFQTDGIQVKKYFVFDEVSFDDSGESGFINASVRYVIKNTKPNQLGRPLPMGIVRVFLEDSQKRPQLLGEDRIDHTPENEEIKVKVGQAFDVIATPKKMSNEVIKSGKAERNSFSIELRNRKKEEVSVRFYAPLWGDSTITKSNWKFVKETATKSYAEIPLKPNETVNLDYTIESRY